MLFLKREDEEALVSRDFDWGDMLPGIYNVAMPLGVFLLVGLKNRSEHGTYRAWSCSDGVCCGCC